MPAFEELPAKTQRRWWIALGVVVIVAGAVIAWMYWPDDSDDSAGDKQDTQQTADPTNPADARPPMPEAVREQSKEGIEATIRYRYELLNYAQQTRDFDAIGIVDAPSCEFCQSFRDSLPGLLPNGQRVQGGNYSVTAFRDATFLNPHDNEPIGSVEIDLSYESGNIVDRNGQVVDSLEAGGGSLRFSLRYDRDRNHWLITAVEAVS